MKDNSSDKNLVYICSVLDKLESSKFVLQTHRFI